MRKLILVATIFSSLLGANVVVEDIRIIGLQVSLGSVLDTIPVTIGDRITSKLSEIIRTLFATDNLMILNFHHKKMYSLFKSRNVQLYLLFP